MAAVYDDLLRDAILLRKDLEYALSGCKEKQVLILIQLLPPTVWMPTLHAYHLTASKYMHLTGLVSWTFFPGLSIQRLFP